MTRNPQRRNRSRQHHNTHRTVQNRIMQEMRRPTCPTHLTRQSLVRKVLQQLLLRCLFPRWVCLRAKQAVLRLALLCEWKIQANISSDRARGIKQLHGRANGIKTDQRYAFDTFTRFRWLIYAIRNYDTARLRGRSLIGQKSATEKWKALKKDSVRTYIKELSNVSAIRSGTKLEVVSCGFNYFHLRKESSWWKGLLNIKT